MRDYVTNHALHLIVVGDFWFGRVKHERTRLSGTFALKMMDWLVRPCLPHAFEKHLVFGQNFSYKSVGCCDILQLGNRDYNLRKVALFNRNWLYLFLFARYPGWFVFFCLLKVRFSLCKLIRLNWLEHVEPLILVVNNIHWLKGLWETICFTSNC